MLDRYGVMQVLYYTVCVVISLCSPYIRHQTPSMKKNAEIFQAASQCFAHNAETAIRAPASTRAIRRGDTLENARGNKTDKE